MNESPEILKYIWYPELEIYGLDTFGRQRVLKEMSGLDFEWTFLTTINVRQYDTKYKLCPNAFLIVCACVQF